MVAEQKQKKSMEKKKNKKPPAEGKVEDKQPIEMEEKTNQENTQQQLPNKNSKRKLKDVFPFGNYRNYYGYRISQDMDEDPRLKALRREWFEGKNCLDIGCNSGIITIQIAKKFNCRSILGIDIDSDRVADARWQLRKILIGEKPGKIKTKASRLEVSKEVNGSDNSATPTSVERKEATSNVSSSRERELSDIVSFRQENFVHSWHNHEHQYDTILCLSVTKWIHLNWGDDGLMTLFSKIWKFLSPGGILVLEPQPWISYEKKHLVSETAASNYRSIMFRPDCFQEILLDKIGFRRVENLTSKLIGSKTGFDRPIFAFQK